MRYSQIGSRKLNGGVYVDKALLGGDGGEASGRGNAKTMRTPFQTRAVLRGALAWLCLAATLRAEPAVWVVHEKTATIYLLGTVHLLRQNAQWQSPKVKAALGESGELWLEIANVDDQAAATEMLQKYGFDREKTLSSKLTAAQNEKLTKTAADYRLPLATLQPLQPWCAALMFDLLPLVKAGYDPNLGVDRVLAMEAAKKNEPVFGFETMDEQAQMLAGFSQSEQVLFLEQTLDEVAKGTEIIDQIGRAWMNGEVSAIERVLVAEMKEKTPVLYQRLIVERNMRWSAKIAELAKTPGVKMIAVGAGHLAGPESVQVQLAKRGLKAERY